MKIGKTMCSLCIHKTQAQAHTHTRSKQYNAHVIHAHAGYDIKFTTCFQNRKDKNLILGEQKQRNMPRAYYNISNEKKNREREGEKGIANASHHFETFQMEFGSAQSNMLNA